MLHKLDIVGWDEVEPFVKQFEALDKDGNGRLNRADLELIAGEYRRRGTVTGIDQTAAACLTMSTDRQRNESVARSLTSQQSTELSTVEPQYSRLTGSAATAAGGVALAGAVQAGAAAATVRPPAGVEAVSAGVEARA